MPLQEGSKFYILKLKNTALRQCGWEWRDRIDKHACAWERGNAWHLRKGILEQVCKLKVSIYTFN